LFCKEWIFFALIFLGKIDAANQKIVIFYLLSDWLNFLNQNIDVIIN
jgi:hypothetical protein